jgi:hypothetical protein
VSIINEEDMQNVVAQTGNCLSNSKKFGSRELVDSGVEGFVSASKLFSKSSTTYTY